MVHHMRMPSSLFLLMVLAVRLCCCAATWQGRMVAVKIVEYTQEQGQRGPLEGLLSEQVQHPNVVSAGT